MDIAGFHICENFYRASAPLHRGVDVDESAGGGFSIATFVPDSAAKGR
jgi:hypothetical protein